MRRAATAVILAACGSGGGGGAMLPGVSDVEVELDRDSTEAEPAYYLNLHYHYRATRPIDEDTGGLRVRAACQVGALRFADDGAHGYDIERGKKSGWSGAAPFVTNELPDKPSLCEIRFAEQAKFGAPIIPILTLCARRGEKPPRAGACPPNQVAGPGQGGFSVPSLAIRVEESKPGDVFQMGRYLVLDYAVQAHRDPVPETWVEVVIECPTGRDDVSHSEAGNLRAGESFQAGQIKLARRTPDPGMACTVTFTALEGGLKGPRQPIETFCYRDDAVTRGSCAP